MVFMVPIGTAPLYPPREEYLGVGREASCFHGLPETASERYFIRLDINYTLVLARPFINPDALLKPRTTRLKHRASFSWVD